MASKLLAARACPPIVRYLPNLDAAVRHFTSCLARDVRELPESNVDQSLADPVPVNATSLSLVKFEPTTTVSLTDLLLTRPPLTSISVDFSMLQQFAPGVEQRISITPTAMDSLECVAQACPSALKRDLRELFPGNDRLSTCGSTSSPGVTVITLSQRTHNDMSAWSQAVEQEREQLLDKFIAGAKQICESLKQAGYWADFIDPSSGTPYFGAHTNTTLFETDERYRGLGFEVDDLGCCKVIRHKLWGTHAYVGSLFTDAPMDLPVIKSLV